MRTLGVIGNISRDLVSYVDGRRYTLLGGAAMHVALAASRAGLSAVPIAVVGGDLASALRDHRLANLDLAYVKVVPEASCTFHLSYGHEGQLTSAECDFGAAVRVTNHALSVLGRHDSYHVCCRQPLNVSLILDQLTSGSLKFSADFYLASAAALIPTAASSLPYAHAVFVNAAEFNVLRLAVDPARPRAVVVSDGPRPVTLLRHGHVAATSRPPGAAVAEVTGAGDTLAGTYLAAVERGLADADALRAAVNAATEAVRTPGIAITGS